MAISDVDGYEKLSPDGDSSEYPS